MWNDQSTPTFLAERRSGIGGSDVHAVFNLEPWGCARRLWYEKRGITPDGEREFTSAMERGQKLEDLVAEQYAERTGRKITRLPMQRHREHPELLVHIDRAIDGEDPEPITEHPLDPSRRWSTGVLECKTAAREVFFRIKREGMPDAYVLQIQHAMLVTGAKWGAFALLWPDGWQLLHWDVEADGGLQTLIQHECLKFWALVENGPAPERLMPEDGRCHRCAYSYQCQGSVMDELLRAAGAGASVDATLGPLVREFLETQALCKEAQDIHEGVKEELKAALGDRILVEVPGVGKVHFKPNLEWDTAALERARPEIAEAFRTKWDLTALGKAHPELEKGFKRAGTTRPLRVYAAKSGK